MQQEELEQKQKELKSFNLTFQEEQDKRMQAESALLSEGKELAQCQEEVQRLTKEIQMANEKLNELKQTKVNLENAVSELKKEVENLTEQNRSSELLIQELRDEINSLKDSKNELQNEIQSLRSTISQLNTEKDATLFQHQQSVERVSDLESQLLKLQPELEEIEQKVQMLMQDLEQKRQEADSAHAQLQDECNRHTQTEADLHRFKNLHSQLEEEVIKLTENLDRSTKELEELENAKLDLENTSRELKSTILDLNSEKDAVLLQQQQSLAKISELELQLSKTQLELKNSEQKMQLLELEITQKSESMDSLTLSLKDETEKRVQAETSLMSMESMYSQSQEEVNRCGLEIEKLYFNLNELENLSSELNSTILLLNAEKDATDLKNQQSLVRISDLESELSKLQAQLEKIEGKVQMLEQELKHKKEEVDSLQISIQDEAHKRSEGEAALLAMTNLNSESQEEVNRLTLETKKLKVKLSEVENSNTDLENIVAKHTQDIHVLREKNVSTELMIKELHHELDALKELNVKLESEMGLHIGEKEALQRDFACQKEEKQNLEGIHHSLAEEMSTLKSRSAANQKLIEDLQIMNLKLKEVCAKNEVEKALLSEKVQEVEKLSEEFSLMENSLSDANAEMDSLREKIKVLETSEGSLKDVEQHEGEFVVLMDDAISSSVNAAVYEEKALELMTENTELKANLSTHVALIASLSDHVNELEENTLSLSKPYSTESKKEDAEVPFMQERNHGPESHPLPEGTPELQRLIARMGALQVAIRNAKDLHDQESTKSAATLAAAHRDIQELKARGGSQMEAREIYSDNEKLNNVEGSKGKQFSMKSAPGGEKKHPNLIISSTSLLANSYRLSFMSVSPVSNIFRLQDSESYRRTERPAGTAAARPNVDGAMCMEGGPARGAEVEDTAWRRQIQRRRGWIRAPHGWIWIWPEQAALGQRRREAKAAASGGWRQLVKEASACEAATGGGGDWHARRTQWPPAAEAVEAWLATAKTGVCKGAAGGSGGRRSWRPRWQPQLKLARVAGNRR
ncbi:hypothetical protein OsI_33633 [Oryza sativa Indica Group]|uniref:Uncharacterized protein n=1 Tax=Oryza sativa subsp. indica TaxID=39946 RepID=B8BGX1_ORYSI|nr:hypothetical protein OsI_33633 [Oryza sativa Indica Group]